MSANKATIGSGFCGDADAPRAPRGRLTLDQEIERGISLQRGGYESRPRLAKRYATLKDTINAAYNLHKRGTYNEKI